MARNPTWLPLVGIAAASFTGQGTDSTEYAWFVWGPHRSGKLHILPPAAYGRENRKLLRLV